MTYLYFAINVVLCTLADSPDISAADTHSAWMVIRMHLCMYRMMYMRMIAFADINYSPVFACCGACIERACAMLLLRMQNAKGRTRVNHCLPAKDSDHVPQLHVRGVTYGCARSTWFLLALSSARHVLCSRVTVVIATTVRSIFYQISMRDTGKSRVPK